MCESNSVFTFNGLPTITVANVMVLNAWEFALVEFEHVIENRGDKLVVLKTNKNIDILARKTHLPLLDAWKYVQEETLRYYIGTWECKGSPYGVCIYDHVLDPVHDFCLICGHPDERK